MGGSHRSLSLFLPSHMALLSLLLFKIILHFCYIELCYIFRIDKMTARCDVLIGCAPTKICADGDDDDDIALVRI